MTSGPLRLMQGEARSALPYPQDGMAPLTVSPHVSRRLRISPAHRGRGIAIHAGKGSGKSALLGKSQCVQDFLRGVPQVVLDPHGPLVDNFLLAIAFMPRALRLELWPRVRYLDLSGTQVATFPLLKRLPGESLTDAADRFLNAIRKVNPHLAKAPILGYPALVRVGRPVLMYLAALDEPVTAAESLLQSPEAWDGRMRQAEAQHPELEVAGRYLRTEYAHLKAGERMSLTRSFLVEVAPFGLDPALRAMFSGSVATIDLAEVEAKRQIVLLDTRHETNVFRRAFKTRWLFDWFMSYIKARGTHYRLPMGLVIDELTELTNQVSLDVDLFSRDLDELINVYARNYGVWTTLAHQEMFQLSQESQRSLLTMGTQVLGVTADVDAAKRLAEQFFAIDPYHVKRVENVWGSGGYGGSVVVEQREAHMPLDEQILMAAQALLSLRPFEFLVKRADSTRLSKVSFSRIVRAPWPSDYPEALAYIRHQLSMRVGRAPNASKDAAMDVDTNDDRPLGTMKVDPDDTTHDTTKPERLDDDDWTTPGPW